jgi:hypothetical protein
METAANSPIIASKRLPIKSWSLFTHPTYIQYNERADPSLFGVYNLVCLIVKIGGFLLLYEVSGKSG